MEVLNVYCKGRRKSYDCFAIEVRLKNRTLWGYRSTHLYGPHKEYPPPRVSTQPRAIEFLWQTFSAFFQCDDFLEEICKLPTNKDLAFVTVPVSLMLRWHLRRHYYDTLHVLRSDKQTCSHDLKVSGKKTSKHNKSEGNFSNIKKLLMVCEILAW